MHPCDCAESTRLGGEALIASIEVDMEPDAFTPILVCCAYCDKVLRGVDYDSATRLVYYSDGHKARLGPYELFWEEKT